MLQWVSDLATAITDKPCVEHKDWMFWQDCIMDSKCKENYLQILPYSEVCFKWGVVVMVTLYRPRYSSPGVSLHWTLLLKMDIDHQIM